MKKWLIQHLWPFPMYFMSHWLYKYCICGWIGHLAKFLLSPLAFSSWSQECGEKKEAVHLSLAPKLSKEMSESCTCNWNLGHAPGLNYLGIYSLKNPKSLLPCSGDLLPHYIVVKRVVGTKQHFTVVLSKLRSKDNFLIKILVPVFSFGLTFTTVIFFLF